MAQISKDNYRARKCPIEGCQHPNVINIFVSEVNHVDKHLLGLVEPKFDVSPALFEPWFASTARQRCSECKKSVAKSHVNCNKCKKIIAARLRDQPNVLEVRAGVIQQPAVADLDVQLPAPVIRAEPPLAPLQPPAQHQPREPQISHVPAAGSLPSFDEIYFSDPSPTLKSPPVELQGKTSKALTKTFCLILSKQHELIGWKGLGMFVNMVLCKSDGRGGRRGAASISETEERLDMYIEGKWAELWESRSTTAPRPKADDKYKQAIKLLENERPSDACRALQSKGSAPPTQATVEALAALHPQVPPVPKPDQLPDAMQVEWKDVLEALNGFKKGAAPGLSKITHELLLMAALHPQTTDMPQILTAVVNKLLRGDLHPDVVPYFAGGELAALNKEPSGVRPISMGEVLRKVAGKCALKVLAPQLLSFFEPTQFGVTSKNGTELVTHLVTDYIMSHIRDRDAVVWQFDAKNAFNNILRKVFLEEITKEFPSLARYAHLLYCDHAVLRFNGVKMDFSLANGGAQGCNLAGVGFASAIQNRIVKRISAEFGIDLNLWYADDGHVCGKISEVSKAEKFVNTNGPEIGLFPNIGKQVVFFPCTLSGLTPSSDPFPAEMKRALHGITVLGTPVGTDDHVKDVLMAKLTSVRALLADLRNLENVHSAFYLLKTCCSFGKVAQRLRTTCPIQTKQIWIDFDRDVRSCLADMIANPAFSPYECELISLSTKLGGLGLASTSTLSPAAYVASFMTCREICTKLNLPKLSLPPRMASVVTLLNTSISSNTPFPVDLECEPKSQSAITAMIHDKTLKGLLQEAPTPLDKARIIANQCPRSSMHIGILPTRGVTFSNSEMLTLIKLRLGLDIYRQQGVCPKCKSAVSDVKGNHALTCLGDIDKIAIHNNIAAAIGREFCAANFQTRFEVSNLKLSPHTNDRPADLYVYEYERHLGAAFDVTNHSPTAFHNINGTLNGPREDSIVPMPNYAAAVAEQSKFSRYAHLNDRHIIRPLCFQSNGGWSEITQNVLHRCAQRSFKVRNISLHKNLKQITEKIAFTHMRVIANAVNARDPVLYTHAFQVNYV